MIRVTAPAHSRDVRLAGTMNGWDEERMTDPDGDGVFELAFNLAPGTYKYRATADGESIADPGAGPDGATVLVVAGTAAAGK